MSTQIAQAERIHSAAPSIAEFRPGDDDGLSLEHPLSVVRGIVSAVLISIPIWTFFAFVLYLLI
jgi:hypothetical protein